jgi:hypothetical protein
MYWFNAPYDKSVAAWDKLAEDPFRWWRGPGLPRAQRPLPAFYTLVQGYAAQCVLVPPDILPFRPNRVLHVTHSQFADPHASATHAKHARYDRVRIPDLLTSIHR